MKKKYRILMVIRWPVGGIRTFIRYVYRNFDSEKYSFSIIAPEVPELKVLLNDLNDFDITYIPLKEDVSITKFISSIAKTIITKKFDVIHSHGFTSGVFSALPARLSRTKHIMTSHDVLLAKQFKGLKGFFKKRALSFLLPFIDVIHSVSNDAQENLFEFFPDLRKYPNKCIAILNGIDIRQFQNTETRDFRKELNLSDDTFLIGFLGRFMSQKGFLYLVQAIEHLLKIENLPKTPLVLTFNDGGFVREEKGFIRRKGLEKNFQFLPFVPNIASTLKGLDVVVMPSLWEACPLLPMEATVAGVPIIGTDCIGLREVLNDTPSTVVSAGNSLAIADAIDKEIKNPSTSIVRAYAAKATQRFDVRRQAGFLENIIVGLIK